MSDGATYTKIFQVENKLDNIIPILESILKIMQCHQATLDALANKHLLEEEVRAETELYEIKKLFKQCPVSNCDLEEDGRTITLVKNFIHSYSKILEEVEIYKSKENTLNKIRNILEEIDIHKIYNTHLSSESSFSDRGRYEYPALTSALSEYITQLQKIVKQ